MKRDPRNLLALAFVLAGVIPVVIWLAAWAERSMTFEQAVEIALVAVLLVVVWRIRIAWEGRNQKGTRRG